MTNQSALVPLMSGIHKEEEEEKTFAPLTVASNLHTLSIYKYKML